MNKWITFFGALLILWLPLVYGANAFEEAAIADGWMRAPTLSWVFLVLIIYGIMLFTCRWLFNTIIGPKEKKCTCAENHTTCAIDAAASPAETPHSQ